MISQDSGLDVSMEGSTSSQANLDSSVSSIEEEYEVVKAELKEAKKKMKEMETKITSYEETFSKLEKIGKFFVREKSGGTPSYGNDMCELLMTLLSDGLDASKIVKFFERLIQSLPVLLDVNLGENSHMTRSIPKETFVKKLRNAIPYLNRECVREFISNAKELTISSDDSPSLDGKTNYTSVGAFNEMGEFCLVGYRQNMDKTGEGTGQNFKILNNPFLRKLIVCPYFYQNFQL